MTTTTVPTITPTTTMRQNIPWVAYSIGGLSLLLLLNDAPLRTVGLLIVLCLPAIIADVRAHYNKLAIIGLNAALFVITMAVVVNNFGGLIMIALVFFLGSIGWMVAFAWSLTRGKQIETVR